jgi:pimeloyl-ACP methyl ester carboxylesterase
MAKVQKSRWVIAWIAVCFLGFASFTHAEDFRTRVLDSESTPMVLNPDQIIELNSLQFIFVDGTFGELFQSNFDPALGVVQNEWPNAETVVIRPQTRNDIPTNSEILFSEIKTYRQNSLKKNAVIIAHSKGAAEITLMALDHPELISEMGVIGYGMVSGPIGGTNIVDFVGDECAIGTPLCVLLNDKLPFLRTFTPDIIQPIFAGALSSLTPDARANFAAKVFFVRTEMQDRDLISPLYATHLYLSLHEHEMNNDGLIPTENELLWDATNGSRVVGTDLGVMFGDHNSLLNKAMDNSTGLYRQAFFRTLVARMLFGELAP